MSLLVSGVASRYSLLFLLLIINLTALILGRIRATHSSSLSCSGTHYGELVSAVVSSGGIGGDRREEEEEEGEVCIYLEIIKISLIVNLTSVWSLFQLATELTCYPALPMFSACRL